MYDYEFKGDTNGRIMIPTPVGEVDLVKLKQNSLSVRDFGAVGDGLSDDTKSIINCIEKAKEGETVVFPTGVYKITSEIIINKSINVDFGNSIIECYSSKGFTFTGSLKSTHSVTSDYVKGINSLVLNSTTGIEVGDIINVISTELFDTSRLYYFKGGNALITKIVGNTVYFNLCFPFNMTANTITAKIYKPLEVNISNIKLLIGKNDLSQHAGGIYLQYVKNSSVENVKIDNFKSNMNIERSVNCSLSFIETMRAKRTTVENWDGYGITIYSCTNITGKNLITNSGQHGLTWGGQEVNYGLYFENSIFKAEVWNLGVGSHENVYDITFVNCKFFGASLGGQCVCINCDFQFSEVLSHENFIIGCGEQGNKPNYSFENCNFNSRLMSILDYYQVVCPTRKYIGNILFNNCKGLRLTSVVISQSLGNKIAEIDKIGILNTNDFFLSFRDIVDTIIISNSETTFNSNIISQSAYNTVFQKVKNIIIDNVKIPRRFNAINIENCDKVIIKNLAYNTTDYNNGQETYKNIGELIIENFNNEIAQRGLIIDNISKLILFNSSLKFASGTMAENINKGVKVEAKVLKVGSETFDIITSPNNSKYKIVVNNTGTQVITII